MSNQRQPNFGFPGGSAPYQNYPPGTNSSYTVPNISPQQQFQNFSPDPNIIPQQQCQNFSNQPSQGMGDYQNPGAGYPQPGYPPQVGPGYQFPQQPQIAPGYPPQQQPQITPGYPPTNPQAGGYQGQFPNPAISPPGPGIVPPCHQPTAPDMNNMQPMPGYEGLTFEQTVLVPPSVPDWIPEGNNQNEIQNMPNFSEEEVRDAAIQFASEHCCYGSAPVKDMQLRDIQMTSAFHYKLETFTEKRESSWKFEPYNGQPIDGPQNGPPPSPWEVMAIPQNYFTDSKAVLEVPHTAFTRPCHTCVGNGRIRCEACMGNGRKQCTWCKGRGKSYRFDKEENCTHCNATGFERCFKCSGTGQVKCKTCDARGTLKGFVELVVTWTNHSDNYISEVACMPKELILEVTGQTAYEEENPRVFPIVQGAEVGVCDASSNLIKKHGSAFTNERILKQRQHLRMIPIGNVKFEWKNKVDSFCVYGFEHKVYFKEYPQKCCCVIL